MALKHIHLEAVVKQTSCPTVQPKILMPLTPDAALSFDLPSNSNKKKKGI
jgi:hypothetical protein